MKLSILIPSVHTRRNTFLPRILNNIYGQYERLDESKKKEVEILTFIDNKKIMLGDKRNLMIEQAQGDYIVFVDDDDIVSEEYISELLTATYRGADVITFKVEVSINGGEKKICYYSKDYEKDYNTSDSYYRLPNHICCVRRDLAIQVEFPSVLYGEDSAYSKMLKPLLKSEVMIDKVLYSYNYNSNTTETQINLRSRRRYNVEKIHTSPLLDLVILSDAKDNYFKGLTEQAVRTALENSKGYNVNIIVMEKNPSVAYAGTNTIHYNEFNYNKLANDGAKAGDAPYIMVANNDLIFKEDWLFKLLETNHPIVSPKCPIDPRQTSIKENSTGLELIKNFSGWCFMIKRSIWEQIGEFDEDFEFWFADNAVLKQLEKHGYESMLVVDSLVEHLGSQTLKTLSSTERNHKTMGQIDKFNSKYDEHQFNR